MINKNGWRTCYYYIIGGFYNNAKAILTTRIAGGLFVSQSSVFRINEKLHNGKQGFALTIKNRIDAIICDYPVLTCSFDGRFYPANNRSYYSLSVKTGTVLHQIILFEKFFFYFLASCCKCTHNLFSLAFRLFNCILKFSFKSFLFYQIINLFYLLLLFRYYFFHRIFSSYRFIFSTSILMKRQYIIFAYFTVF